MLARVAGVLGRQAGRRAEAACCSRRFCAAAAENEKAELEAKIVMLKEQVAEWESKQAESKRDSAQQQKRQRTLLDNETKYGITKFATQLLVVADNLQRAGDSVKPEDLESDRDLRKMHSSVTRMHKVLHDTLEEFGVRKMEAMDQTFDPDKHEAMFSMAMPGKEPNTIFHVLEPGYEIHERTLRAAKVGITPA
eukprot:gnl/TRDRNA2_/TRDRNA2_185693_c0_seq1.p1 gnl/TRDRNA2_/TRDRNA2_185693_c0~~gnl/TRDRNA2_/TRDRNA2_185693_c0_seq1.p1  ORF type:complete len:214 (+),score=50.79 gnl/TRDRNA2_/TRDRNA2_185693_c0_seq1:61-642(+)